MTYTADEIARFVLAYCTRQGKPITNLKLQKILYFLWGRFYCETGRELFTEDICAWNLGPVVPDVYYDYCRYAAAPIRVQEQEELDCPADEALICAIVDDYRLRPVGALVNKTHKEGTPWHQIYGDGEGNRCVIPPRLIKNDFEG